MASNSWFAFLRRTRPKLSVRDYVSLITPRISAGEAVLLDELSTGPKTLTEIAAAHTNISRRTFESLARLYIASGAVETCGMVHVFTTGRRCRRLRLSKVGRKRVAHY